MLRFADITKLTLVGAALFGAVSLIHTGHAAADPFPYHYGNYGVSSQPDQNPSQQFNNDDNWPGNADGSNYGNNSGNGQTNPTTQTGGGYSQNNTTDQAVPLSNNQGSSIPIIPPQPSGDLSSGDGIVTATTVPTPTPAAAIYPTQTDYQDYQRTPPTTYIVQDDSLTKPPCPTLKTIAKPCPPTPSVTPPCPKSVTPPQPPKPCPTTVRPPTPKLCPITTTSVTPPQGGKGSGPELTMSAVASIVPTSAPVPALPITPAAVPTAVVTSAPAELTNTGVDIQFTSVIAATFLAVAGFVFSRRIASDN
jgi:hypothetical protein